MKNFYTQSVGGGFMSVAYETSAQAEEEALISSADCMEVRVYDCSKSPAGVLIATYVKGKKSGDAEEVK